MSASEKKACDMDLLDHILDANDMARLLKKSVLTIKRDVNRRPDSLPPRTLLPGSTRLIWRRSNYISWMESLPLLQKIEVTERGPGRPPICRQISVKKRLDTEPNASEVLQNEEKPRNKGGRPRKYVGSGGGK